MPRQPQTTLRHCDAEGCSASIPDHAWGRIKAEGWFFTRAGEAFCPEHVPDWVGPWRERIARAKERRAAGVSSTDPDLSTTGGRP